MCLRSAWLLALLAVASLAAHPAHPAATLTANVQDGAGRPVENAVVYALPSGAVGAAAKNLEGAVNQVDREFAPFMTVVQPDRR